MVDGDLAVLSACPNQRIPIGPSVYLGYRVHSRPSIFRSSFGRLPHNVEIRVEWVVTAMWELVKGVSMLSRLAGLCPTKESS